MQSVQESTLLFLPVSIVVFVKKGEKEGHFSMWMQKRMEEGALFGLWEFPGGKIEQLETPEAAAKREVKEEVGFEMIEKPIIFKFHHYVYKSPDSKKEKPIGLYVFLSKERPAKDQGQWFDLNPNEKSLHLKGLIPPVNHQIIDEILDYLKAQDESSLWDRIWI